jgi:hypothetical protein
MQKAIKVGVEVLIDHELENIPEEMWMKKYRQHEHEETIRN